MLQDVLGYTELIGEIQETVTGIPKVVPEAFWTVTEPVTGDKGRYTVFGGQRETLRRAEYGSPARKGNLRPLKPKDVILNHFYEYIDLKVTDYQNLINYADPVRMEMGRREVDNQILHYRKKIDNTRVSLVMSMLAHGAIYYDEDGNLLPTSSGAFVTIDYEIPANNKNQLNGIIAASWATTTTDIPGQLTNLDQRAAQLTGYPLKYAFYGANVASYLAKNDLVKAYLSYADGGRRSAEYLNAGTVPDGLFGLTWVPVYRSHYARPDGTISSWFPADQVTFAPEIDATVYSFLEGTYPVPTTYEPQASGRAAYDSFDHVEGVFSYAEPINNPPTARVYFGDTCLPVWKVPSSLFIADVTP
jgi:hypothetical protein